MNYCDVYLEDKAIGHAELHQEGLYLHVVARCADIPPRFYRLYLYTNLAELDLGICRCENSVYIWDKKIPLKRIHGEIIRLSLDPSVTSRDARFFPIDPNKEFLHFYEVSICIYTERDEEKGVCITDHPRNVRDC